MRSDDSGSGDPHRRRPSGRWRAGLAAAGACLTLTGALAAPSVAGAAPAPSVTTGAAREVSFATAVLGGTVNPNGSETDYYFQYGVTRAYGGQSGIADAGAGTHSVDVRLGINGLQPLTLYHYRLVAVSAGGISFGADHTFVTTKVPLSLQILASPNPVSFGGNVLVQGTLSGTGNANREVVLQANTFPFTAGFVNTGNPELTTAAGEFRFPVLGVIANTQFRVVTTTNPPVVSPIAAENVAVRVTSHVGRTHRRHFARIFGTVTPAENGMKVGILREVHGRGIPVAGTELRPLNAGSSRYSRVIRVHPGVYRVFVQVVGVAQVSSYGPLLGFH